MDDAQTSGGRQLWWWLGGVLVLVVVVLVASWTWVTVRGDGRAGHVVTGAADDLQEATFVLLDGADVIRVRTADLGEDAYRVSTPRDASVRPAVSRTDDTLMTSLRGTGKDGPAIVEVVLRESVRWHIRLDGGAKEQHLDLSDGRVNGVEFTAGANRIELTLPAPTGTQRVVLGGGASQVVVRLGTDAPVQVRAGVAPARSPSTAPPTPGWPAAARSPPRSGRRRPTATTSTRPPGCPTSPSNAPTPAAELVSRRILDFVASVGRLAGE